MQWKETEGVGGDPSKKKHFLKVGKKIIKKQSTRNLKVGACGFNFTIMIQTIF